ncbi:MAG: hypothetical protein Q8761_02580, partial [Sweet potato little leaf phytoplasma]|nr:hypothetical protein [Sweet potato little leaf phytoplasma]
FVYHINHILSGFIRPGYWLDSTNFRSLWRPTRTNILISPLPTMNKVFSLLIQEESQRAAGNLSGILPTPVEAVALAAPTEKRNSQDRPHRRDGQRPICSHCGVKGHVKDRCYKIHGYPPGYRRSNHQPLLVPECVWDDITMDFIEKLPKAARFDTILVVVDRLNKHAHFLLLKHPFTAKEVAFMFVKEVVQPVADPKILFRGASFEIS